jgi:AcrR family transcriptional regulator
MVKFKGAAISMNTSAKNQELDSTTSTTMQSATKKRILVEAFTLFSDQGYDKTSISDILTKSKLTKGALYHYFKSKDDIFISCIRSMMEYSELKETFPLSQIKNKQQFKKSLLDCGNVIIQMHINDPRLALMHLEVLFQVRKNKELKLQLEQCRCNDDTFHLKCLVLHGLTKKYFSKHLSAQEISRRMMMAFHAISIEIALANGKSTVNFTQYWKTQVDGLL